MREVKTRNWLAVFYPDSAPEDWEDVIDAWQVTAYVSPLHDMDERKGGGFKKAHYHLVVCFDGPKSYSAALSMICELGCATVKPANSLSGSLRYLCHMDSPGKAQYCVSDIVTFGHADLSAIYQKTDGEVSRDCKDLVSLVRTLGVNEFSTLVNVVMEDYPEYFDTLRGQTAFFRAYLMSLRGINNAPHI